MPLIFGGLLTMVRIQRLHELFERWEIELRQQGVPATVGLEEPEFPLFDDTDCDTAPEDVPMASSYSPHAAHSSTSLLLTTSESTPVHARPSRLSGQRHPIRQFHSVTARSPYFGSPYKTPDSRFQPTFGLFRCM